eukprot:CAMPEP_0179061438 /NCGR_PEP_ID=MMETSP0796-20121207/26397_1 /TAXON_ID=73915 /ORGANISM="Pyrodinium bahamense, Strain pbaha01" /LENGTH=54 /DNA_ID=CAMNT_0020758283 /DNA_START=130 /DNA_END=290 /DNA_ORIENTATION=-
MNSQLILTVRLDGDVGGGVRDARKAIAIAHLIVVEEGLVGLVDRPREDLAGAAG